MGQWFAIGVDDGHLSVIYNGWCRGGLRCLSMLQFRGFDLFQLELLSLLEELLTLDFEHFAFAVHDRFELFEMPQFDFEFLDLHFDHLSNGRFDFAFFDRGEVLKGQQRESVCGRFARASTLPWL